MTRRTVLLLLLAACTSSGSDTDPDGSSTPPDAACNPMGIDFAANPAGSAPQAGDSIQYTSHTAFCLDGEQMTGLVSRYATAPSGEVYCAVTWAMSGSRTAECAECTDAWSVTFALPVDHGAPFCDEALGFDPASIDLDFYVGYGYATAPLAVWVQEEGFVWEPVSGAYDPIEETAETVVLTYDEAFTL
jgi:hypothetical protein